MSNLLFSIFALSNVISLIAVIILWIVCDKIHNDCKKHKECILMMILSCSILTITVIFNNYYINHVNYNRIHDVEINNIDYDSARIN